MPEPANPLALPEVARSDVIALQAVYRGEADPDQQTRAIQFILGVLCRPNEGSFRLGPDGDRLSSLNEGRRLVGNHIVSLTLANPADFKSPR